MTKQNGAVLACLFSGLIFGIYWIPLRFVEDAGFSGTWATVMFNLVPLVLISPLLIYRLVTAFPRRSNFHLTALMTGIAYVFYANAFLHTEVVRAIVFFYLMPVWGFLLARFFIGEKITPVRWLSMGFGLVGLFIISGEGGGISFPDRTGDWMALGAGLCWAAASLMILTDKQDSLNYALGMLFWGAVVALILALIATQQGYDTYPEWKQATTVLAWMIPFTLLIIIPATFATVYGPSLLNPGVVGLLFMSEISIGTATAAFFAGEPFGLKEILGIIFITCAGLAEPLKSILIDNRRELTA